MVGHFIECESSPVANRAESERATLRRSAAWGVHLLTATGAVCGLFALSAIHQGAYVPAFWWMGLAVTVDAFDGLLARRIGVKRYAPQIDGCLLDNLVDFVTYVIVPAFLFLESTLLPRTVRTFCAGAIVLASTYQFSHQQAKTSDHFFRGFPSYWNILALYLFCLRLSEWMNVFIICSCLVLVFVPIKYIYPSRPDYLSNGVWIPRIVYVATIVWGVATLGLLWQFPDSNPALLSISLSYVVLYFGFSLFRTFVPVRSSRPD